MMYTKSKYPIFGIIATLSVLFFFMSPVKGAADTIKYLYEGFESGYLPTGWTEVHKSGLVDWEYVDGGMSADPSVPESGHPPHAKEGTKNARFFYSSTQHQTTQLITKKINLAGAKKPVLTFWHAQAPWAGSQDKLRVLYKTSAGATWDTLAKYTSAVNNWTRRIINLPAGTYTANYYIAFEAETGAGFGVCIDSVFISETDTINKYVSEFKVNNYSNDFIASGTLNNPVMRIDINVFGNQGQQQLKSISLHSLNQDENDIKTGGVKLFYTTDSIFSTETQLGTAQNFSNHIATFSGLNKILPNDYSFIWVTYDIKDIENIHNHIIDAKLDINSVSIGDSLYPKIEESPTGYRYIRKSIYITSFEANEPTVVNWDLTGEFEIDTTQGKGGTAGNPDPKRAYNGFQVLGEDLSGTGSYPYDYEKNLTLGSLMATSDTFDCKFYKNIKLSYYRWLNVESYDDTWIEVSTDKGATWTEVWGTYTLIQDGTWKFMSHDISEYIDRTGKTIIRFNHTTDGSFQYSGWNIDDFAVTGEFISDDIGVSQWLTPVEGCGKTNNETVSAVITNYAGVPTNDTLLVSYSFYGGDSLTRDTIFQSIPVDGSITFTFKKKVNLSKPGIYSAFITTSSPGDQEHRNDTVHRYFYAQPTYSIPFATNFDQTISLWKKGGTSPSWQHGTPADGNINSAASSPYSWKTSLTGNYNANENSFVESPCFDFTSITYPIFEFKYWSRFIKGEDGCALLYSTNGTTWNPVPKHAYAWKWNWYNSTNVPALGYAGWDTTTTGWITAKQFLPGDIVDEPSVKFRIRMASDAANSEEGFAFDDVKIYNAPFDLGISQILNITNNETFCQHTKNDTLTVKLKNYGIRPVLAGDTVFLGCKLDANTPVMDTLVMTGTLAGNAELTYKFKKPVNFQVPGNHVLHAFAADKQWNFYETRNDTLSLNINVLTSPVIGLNKTYSTARLDTLKLKPVYSTNYDYEWHHLANVSYDSVLLANDIGVYNLTVTDITNSCTTSLDITVYALHLDIGIDSIIAPVTHCAYGNNFRPIVRLFNFKTDTIAKNKVVPIKLRFRANNKDSLINDQITLSRPLAPDSTYIVTLNTSLSMANTGNYQLMARTYLEPYDDDNSNDSSTNIVEMYPYPNVNLGADRKINAATYTLDAGAGFTTYRWSKDSAQTQAIQIDTVGNYSVTVTNTYGCPDIDTVRITLTQHDIGIKRIISPVTSCTLSATTPVRCVLMNYGTDTIRTNEVITMSYKLDNNSYVNQSYSVPAPYLLPGDSVPLTFTSTVNLLATGTVHGFVVRSATIGDLNSANDSIRSTVHVWGNPTINIGPDQIVNALTYTVHPNNYGFIHYQWQDSSSDSIYTITRNHFNTNNTYSLTVTDEHGCKASDLAYIWLVIHDVSISLVSPTPTSCAEPGPKVVGVKVKITGNEPELNPKDIRLRYRLNSEPEVTEYLRGFKGDIGDSSIFSFTQPIYLTQPGVNQILATLFMEGDVDHPNDTVKQTINVFYPPVVDLGIGSDTILTVDLPHTLDAGTGTGYTYLWLPDSILTQSMQITKEGVYTAKVTDLNGCSGSKKVRIINHIIDLDVESLLLAGTMCSPETRQKIGFTVKNNGRLSIDDKSITIRYLLDNSSEGVLESAIFNGAPAVKDTFYFTTTADLSQAGAHTLNISLDYSEDEVSENNDSVFNVMILEKPVVNFGITGDTIKASTLPYIIDAGQGSGYTYLWDNGATTQTCTATSGTTEKWYKVLIKNSLNCPATDSVYVVNATSVPEMHGRAVLSLFPNPVRQTLYVQISLKAKDNIVFELISPSGATVLNKPLKGNTQYLESIDVSNLPKGMYLIRAYNSDWVVTDKVVIQ